MMVLFTKPDCKKCDWIKENCDLSGIYVVILTPFDPAALAELAWCECVGLAEETLPILVLDDKEKTKVTGAIEIKKVLEGR
jgi:hypothetical protein